MPATSPHVQTGDRAALVRAASVLLAVAMATASAPNTLAVPALTMGDINPGADGSSAMWTAGVLGDQLLFGANDGVHGYELWKTNATSSGVTFVKDIWPGSPTDSSSPSQFTELGGYLYFTAEDGTHGVELWRTNGTTAGTALVKDIYIGGNSSNPAQLTRVGSVLYFTAYDGVHGQEVWVTDGTAAGTTLVADINVTAGNTGSDPNDLYSFNDSLWLRADNGEFGAELWQISDVAIVGFDLHAGPLSSYPREFTTFSDGKMYFQAYDQTNGTELWRTDGISAPVLFADIATGSEDSSPSEFTELNGNLYFAARTTAEGRELWSTNGTTTALAADIWAGSASSNPEWFVALGTTLYYAAEISGNTELHRFDGTSDVLVGEINLGGSSYLNSPVVVGDALYVAGYDGASNGIARIVAGSDAISFFTAPGANSFISCMCSPLLKVLGGRVYAPAFNDEVGMEYAYLDEPTYVLPATNRTNSMWGITLALAAALVAATGAVLRRREGNQR
jgi:ELWxxDGT repeat protein